jgi:methylmalonyl-CoA/ethylmalonyl-CoA epimerase
MSVIKKINHVAVVVEDMDKALRFWRDTLGMDFKEQMDITTEASAVAFLPVGESDLELVKPTSQDSGIAKYLAKRGPGMHHICLEVDDLMAMVSKLKQSGIRLINEQPRLGHGGRQYAFVHPESTGGVLVELYQSE